MKYYYHPAHESTELEEGRRERVKVSTIRSIYVYIGALSLRISQRHPVNDELEE